MDIFYYFILLTVGKKLSDESDKNIKISLCLPICTKKIFLLCLPLFIYCFVVLSKGKLLANAVT